MQPGLTRSIRGNDSGAIAPMYALSLFALVAIAGVGFDVGRMYAMDSELQNAADQAALAAATQLDGKDDSITRAQQAANNYFANAASGFANETRFAGGERPITALTFQFYHDYRDDEPVDLLDASDEDSGAAARIVLVTVNGREMFYALTPIVDAFSSGDITASAMAGIQSATCKVPPLMICAPSGDFPTDDDKGKGVLMQGGARVGFWEPGDFGYLDLVGGGANGLRDLLGSNGFQDACISNDGTVEAQPGNIANAPDALNTIFDIKPQGGGNQYDCQNNGAFCPVKNTRKDYVRREEWAITYPKNPGTPPPIKDCQANPVDSSTGNGNNATTLDVTVRPMLQSDTDHLEGFARDSCHYTNSCGRFGDGNWGRDAYVNQVHNGNTAPFAGLTTRYEIYQKEIELDALGIRPLRRIEMVGPNCPTNGNRPCTMSYTNICAYPQPLNSPAYPFEKDRRVMTVAAADCSAQADENSHEYRVQKWVDIFLVEPSVTRTGSYPTGKDQIYGEIIGPAERPGGGFGFQYFGRNKVVLIR
jgi:hypothetical protein